MDSSRLTGIGVKAMASSRLSLRGWVVIFFVATYCTFVTGCVYQPLVQDPRPTARSIVAIEIEQLPKDPGAPDKPSSNKCRDCNGTGIIGDGRIKAKCETCNGTGRIKE